MHDDEILAVFGSGRTGTNITTLPRRSERSALTAHVAKRDDVIRCGR
jgi:hypothetical protein